MPFGYINLSHAHLPFFRTRHPWLGNSPGRPDSRGRRWGEAAPAWIWGCLSLFGWCPGALGLKRVFPHFRTAPCFGTGEQRATLLRHFSWHVFEPRQEAGKTDWRKQFKTLLLKSYQNYVRAWRMGLDRDHNGHLDYNELLGIVGPPEKIHSWLITRVSPFRIFVWLWTEHPHTTTPRSLRPKNQPCLSFQGTGIFMHLGLSPNSGTDKKGWLLVFPLFLFETKGTNWQRL